jgi:hypothetical protein
MTEEESKPQGWNINKMQVQARSGDELQAGPSQTPEQLEKMQWAERKQRHIDTLNPDELKRALAEKEEKQRLLLEEQRQTELAIKERERQYWDGIEKSCLDGSPEERFARFLVRASMKGIFGLNPMQDPREKARIITDLLKCHGIALKDSKTKPSRAELEQTVSFVSDPYVKKGDVTMTRRLMFPEKRTE